jgi:lysophospholipase L1-like esterase
VSNVFGTSPLTVDDSRVAVHGAGAAIEAVTSRPATFDGLARVTVAPGTEVWSDPVPLAVAADRDLAVSLYFRAPTGPLTWHPLAMSTSYLATGDHSADVGTTAFTRTSTSWYVLDGVDVHSPAAPGSVVAFGDSITDGAMSTPDTDQRYPDDLAGRLLSTEGVRAPSVLDEGISGNRLLTDAGSSGINAQSRFQRDVLDQTGVRAVIILEGINDIGHNLGAQPGTEATTAALIAALQSMADRAHARGLRVIAGTLTPFAGSKYDTPAARQKRDELNAWIRTTDAFDAVVDFDAAVRDPADPQRYLPAYDSGDHLHPDDAGYRAMAGAVDLGRLG